MLTREDERLLVVFITGLSGAGLKTSINTLEDTGAFYCIDNLPLAMIEPSLDLLNQRYRKAKEAGLFAGIHCVVFGLHFEGEHEVEDFLELRTKLEKRFVVDLIFLTADPQTIEDRYGANRRKHPMLSEGVALCAAIARESELLQKLEKHADYIIDTSALAPQQLGKTIELRYHKELPARQLNVSLVSFGFKHGLLRPVDILFDVRFLPNPYFTTSLRSKTGFDTEVQEFLFREAAAVELLQRLQDWFTWLFPLYYEEGKHYLRVGIGCTGGQHRSVAVVEELGKRLAKNLGGSIHISKSHRDLGLLLR